ncbi:hypothetical protein ACB092_09G076500 [Castanea dentata]
MTECPACYGRGLIAHRDGSDTKYVKCNGKGKIPCDTCASCGLSKCETCNASGSLRSRKVTIVQWKTLSTRIVSATSGAASVLMKFSPEPKVSSCATLRHINALLPFLLTLSLSTSFLLKLLPREHLYLPLLESYVRGIPSPLCQLRVSPCLIAIDPSVSILLALAGRST